MYGILEDIFVVMMSSVIFESRFVPGTPDAG